MVLIRYVPRLNLAISSRKRVKALCLSPYMTGMKTSKMPIKQYALSSTREVTRFSTQDMRSSTMKFDKG